MVVMRMWAYVGGGGGGVVIYDFRKMMFERHLI